MSTWNDEGRWGPPEYLPGYYATADSTFLTEEQWAKLIAEELAREARGPIGFTGPKAGGKDQSG